MPIASPVMLTNLVGLPLAYGYLGNRAIPKSFWNHNAIRPLRSASYFLKRKFTNPGSGMHTIVITSLRRSSSAGKRHHYPKSSGVLRVCCWAANRIVS
jgi:hypothetical protein